MKTLRTTTIFCVRSSSLYTDKEVETETNNDGDEAVVCGCSWFLVRLRDGGDVDADNGPITFPDDVY